MYERTALVLDGGGELAELPLALASLGLASVYAQDLDEPLRSLSEGAVRVGTVLLPADALRERRPALVQRIVEPLGLRVSAVVPVGARVGLENADALAKLGLRWALWRPFAAPDLRFVVTQALASADSEEPRLHPRVPCALPAQLKSPLRQAVVTLSDLSPGGCFARFAEGFPRSARVRLRCEPGGRRIEVSGRVAWETGPGTPGWRGVGIGIEFLEMPDDARALLTRQVDERLGRYRIQPD